MKKYVGWILILILSILCLSAFAEGDILFPLTNGNPIDGSEVSLRYNVEVISETINEGNIISLKKTQLDNGYSRYVLEYDLPEGYGMAFFGSSNKTAKVKMKRSNGLTSGGPGTVTFDIEDEKATADDSILLSIAKADDDRMFVSFHPLYQKSDEGDYFTLTGGKPVDGFVEQMTYEVFPSGQLAGENNIISLTKMQLDNEYSRYTLEFDLPEGYILGVFGAGNDERLKTQRGTASTAGGPETATFDVSDMEAKAVDSVCINLYNTETDDRLIVSFQPFGNRGWGITSELTGGNLIDGSEQNVDYFFDDEASKNLRASVISLRKVSLDNGCSRYYLEHCIPEGYQMFIFGIGDDPRLSKQMGDGKTNGEQDTIVFDMNDNEVRVVGTVVVGFDRSTGERFFILISPFNETENMQDN